MSNMATYQKGLLGTPTSAGNSSNVSPSDESGTPVVYASTDKHDRGGGGGDDEGAPLSQMEVEEEGVDVFSPSVKPFEGKASLRGTVLNMMCNVIGGGVLALPTGFYESSMIVGLILLVVVSSITILNLYFIVECADATRIYTYRLLLIEGIGERGARAVDFALFVFPFGALVTYARVIADVMPPVMKSFLHAKGFWLNEICWFLIGGVLFFVLSCRRSLSELKLTSIFGLATIFYAVFLVIYRFFDGTYSRTGVSAEVDKEFDAAYLHWGVFKTIPILTFSLSVHNNAPAYYEELENRSPKKMYKVIGYAHAGIFSTYALMAVFGLLTFGPRIQHAKGDILDAYDEDDNLINSARLLMFLHFACVYPILQMAARRGLNNFVFKHTNLPMVYLVIESFFIVVGSCVLAALIPNIGTIVSVNGSAFGSVIILIAPSLLFIKIDPFGSNAMHHLVHPSEKKRNIFRGLAFFSIITGVIVGILGVVVTFVDV